MVGIRLAATKACLDARRFTSKNDTMKFRVISVPLMAALLAGCVGSGPNTQRGAVAGGALGALAGGIIGNNSGGRTWQGAAIGGAVGALAGGTLGNTADHENGTVYGAQSAAPAPSGPPQQTVVVTQPPPPQTVIVTQAPSPAVWIDSYWAWTPRGNVWVAAHWETPPPGCRHFVAPHWEHHRGRRVYVAGSWR